jgi:hypothetical protein
MNIVLKALCTWDLLFWGFKGFQVLDPLGLADLRANVLARFGTRGVIQMASKRLNFEVALLLLLL